LQHGALPLYGDLDRIFACLRTRTGCRSLRDRAITLEQALGRTVSFEEVAQALAQGFSQALNLELIEGSLSEYELHLAEELYRTRYTADEWNCRL
jgi:lipoate-protein ligase A